MRALSLAVVGADYPNKRGPTRRFEIELCKPGEAVQLLPEPKNKADRNAIAVLSARGVQIGYLTAERVGLIHKAMRDGFDVRAIFQKKAPYGAVIRVGFDEDPTLPPDDKSDPWSPPEPEDFWPDFMPPDE